ncbi:hypothetical protein GCM10007913_40120 [Devosia yakushimensis]|uniref:Methyltransferase type 11 domain-containing protein n=2 Tax=Devosia yakushimensis TaxID=470028 RepID=A0ABQ5UJS3_9HYPH|nr:hypothetical protein GCM10007913_40120 [Devosia yakushimensis]
MPHLKFLGNETFGFIILSAVWMFVPEKDRHEAARRLSNLIRPGGKIAVSLRPLTGTEPGFFSRDDIQRTATIFAANGLTTVERYDQADTLGRPDRNWTTLVFQMPGYLAVS